MFKKICYYLTVLTLLALVGCESEITIPEGYYTFEKAQIEQAIHEVTFNPAIPEYIPIPVAFIISDPYVIAGTNHEALDISFYSEANDLLTYQVTDGSFELGVQTEAVKLNSTTSADYYDNGFAKILIWEKEGLSYKLEFRSSVIGNDDPSRPVSKEDLIKVVQSCNS